LVPRAGSGPTLVTKSGRDRGFGRQIADFNYDRLARVKARYDPDNLFHVNQNFQPASQAGA
jgi:hypothetical protein